VSEAAATATAPATSAVAPRVQAAWAVLQGVPDPEIPVLSLPELGVVREVRDQGDVLEVVLTPTYSGCPATEVIANSVQQALRDAGLGPVQLTQRLAPPWTTDWISPAGREKLRGYGIAPPGAAEQPVRLHTRVPCPRCGSNRTERLAAFGSTPCKALHRCLDCLEPFDHFKPI
jgi:ring-1,2-phenylacetyl-CoA epoxidase subunit PaaD